MNSQPLFCSTTTWSKRLLTALVLSILGFMAPAQAQTRILFVGNSFTYGTGAVRSYNAAAVTDENAGQPAGSPRNQGDPTEPRPWGGIPAIFKKLTDQTGLVYEVHMEAVGGSSLQTHYNNALSVIQQSQWDQVVLQELSTLPLPVSRGGQPAIFLDYATRLEQAVHTANPAAQVYLYETWARPDLTYPAGSNYEGLPIDSMSEDLHDKYFQALAQNSNFAAVAPVGDAWMRAITTNVAMRNPFAPTAGLINLWDTDNFHPSKWGAYLSACVLFYQITDVDPRGFGPFEQAAVGLGIPGAETVYLQQLAYEQVQAANNPQPAVTSFTLINADTDQPIQTLTNGAALNLATLPTANLNIRANTTPSLVGSVVFALSGAVTENHTESGSPYALFADSDGDYNPWLPVSGSYSLQATPYSESGGNGTPGTTLTINFTVTNQGPGGKYTLTVATAGRGTVTKSPNQAGYGEGSNVTLTATPAAGYDFSGWSGDSITTANPLAIIMDDSKNFTATFSAIPQYVTSFTLINADTDQPIQTLAPGAVLNLATLPTTNLNVRANTQPALVGSIVFALSGTGSQSQTESVAPYALYSDTDGDYNPWVPATGSYSLQAMPYSEAGGNGNPGTGLTVGFTVVNQPLVVNYSLTATSTGNGTVSKSPNLPSYVSGSNVSLQATPAAGYRFSGWGGDASGMTNPLVVSMSSNKVITASFTTLAQQVTSFTLINATTNQPIQTLLPGAVLNLATLPTRNLNVRANTSPASVGSVVFRLTGTRTKSRTDITAPYSAFGDVAGDYSPWVPVVGSYALRATPYSLLNGVITAGIPLTQNFTVINQVVAPQYTLTVSTTSGGTVSKSPNLASYISGSNVTLTATPATGYRFSGWSGAASGMANPLVVAMTRNKNITATFAVAIQVTSFTLVNATTNQPIQTLANGATLNLATLPTRYLNVRANVNAAATGSKIITFQLSGARSWGWLDGTAPYAAFGDNAGDYSAWTPALGRYTLRATPYSLSNGYIITGTPLTVSFTVINSTTAARNTVITPALAATTERAQPGAAPAPTAAMLAYAYPNPSPDGHFQVRLPEAFQGDVSYTLVSALGTRVASGKLTKEAGISEVPVYFPLGMTPEGVYYLLLESQNMKAQLKLMRY
jgi:uncharacterized repeat protein (TIGR02543 family)